MGKPFATHKYYNSTRKNNVQWRTNKSIHIHTIHIICIHVSGVHVLSFFIVNCFSKKIKYIQIFHRLLKTWTLIEIMFKKFCNSFYFRSVFLSARLCTYHVNNKTATRILYTFTEILLEFRVTYIFFTKRFHLAHVVKIMKS